MNQAMGRHWKKKCISTFVLPAFKPSGRGKCTTTICCKSSILYSISHVQVQSMSWLQLKHGTLKHGALQAMFWLPKFKHLDYRVHIAVPSNIWGHWRLTLPYANLHALFTWNLLLHAGAENSVGKAPSIFSATFLWGCYALETWCSRTCPLLHYHAHHLRGSPGLGFWTL